MQEEFKTMLGILLLCQLKLWKSENPYNEVEDDCEVEDDDSESDSETENFWIEYEICSVITCFVHIK